MKVRGTTRRAARDMQRRKPAAGYAAGFVLLAATLAHAQVMVPVGTMPDGSHHALPATAAVSNAAASAAQTDAAKTDAASQIPAKETAPPAAPMRAPSLLDEPAQPAAIQLQNGKLSIEANNSAVDEILHTIAQQSGMKIEGLNKDYRVFGSYGPANPREVLSELLSDSGFNIVMVGATADGAPQQLLLTDRGGAPVTPPNPHDPQEAYHPPPPVVYPNPQPVNRGQMNRGPGAPGGVHSPQQILQELERLHQQNEQNQQNTQQ